MRALRRTLLAICALGLMVAFVHAAVNPAGGSRKLQIRGTRVTTGHEYWSYERCPQGIQGAAPANVNRYLMHHSCTISSTLVPVGGVIWWHTNTGTDTITVRFYNGGNADSVRLISAAIETDALPLFADSVAAKPHKTSAAGDWTILTLFKR